MAQTLFPNLAGDTQIRDRILRDLVPQLRVVRDDRRVQREQWLRFWRIWGVDRSDQIAYRGRSRTYLAVGRRIIENWVHKLKADLFPDGDWFDVLALRSTYEDKRAGIKTLLNYFLNKQMRVRRKSAPFLRQLVTLGTSPVSVTWRVHERELPILRAVFDPNDNATGHLERVDERVLDYIGPTFRLVDLFSFYVWPTTVMDLCDASIIFEDQLIERQRLIDLALTPISVHEPDLGKQLEFVPQVLARAAPSAADDLWSAERERLTSKGFTPRYDRKDPARPIDVTTVYWKVDLDGTGTDWWRIVLGAEVVPMKVQRNPFWHGQPPWLVGKFTEIENEFYGRALPEVFDRLQYFLNDLADQANDALTFSLNPIAIVDTYKVQVPESIRLRPGAKWLAEVEGIKFAEPPKDSATVGFAAVSQVIAMMNDVSNVAAFTGGGAPRARGRAVQTATGAQILASENLVQVRDVVENLEDTVFAPLLRMTHQLTLQCLDRPLILRVAGHEGAQLLDAKLTAADIVGDYDFAWLGSTAAHNQQVRAQQMISFLQIAARVPPQLIAPKKIDFGALLSSIWTDGLGLRNASHFITDETPKESMDWRLENDLCGVGRGDEIMVSPADSHAEHLAGHDLGLGDPRLTPDAKQYLIEHMKQHATIMAVARMAEQLQTVQALGSLLQGGGAQPPGAPGPNGAGAPGGMMPPDNPGRPPATNDLADVFRRSDRPGV